MILFRADGNSQIGLGHIMRCMSIADAFVKKGRECLFILADMQMEAFIKNRGFETFVMNTRFDCMEMEFEKMQSLVKQRKPDCIIVDSYFVSEKYLRFLGTLSKVVYMDDLASFAYPVDYLINYNIYSVYIDYYMLYKKENVKLPKCILGSKYTPLRKEFKEISTHIIKEKVENILILTGGADPEHLALRIIKVLSEHSKSAERIRFHIVLGMMNGDKDKIMELAGKVENIFIYSSVENIKTLMLMCDVAVSAAGSTLYELCVCGTPTITYILADNQILGADTFQKNEVMLSAGDIRENKEAPNMIIKMALNLADDYKKRKKMGKRMQKFIDGNGAERLVKKLDF